MTVKRVIIYLNLEINLYEAFIAIGRKIFLPPFRSYYIYYPYEEYLSLSELQIKKKTNKQFYNIYAKFQMASNIYIYIYYTESIQTHFSIHL